MNELRNVCVSFMPDPADTIPVRVAGSFKKNGNPAYRHFPWRFTGGMFFFQGPDKSIGLKSEELHFVQKLFEVIGNSHKSF